MSRNNHGDDVDVLPLYLVFDASAGMAGSAITTVNMLVGEVVAVITGDLQLSESVRLCVVALDDRARLLLALSDLDATAQVPIAAAGKHPAVSSSALVGLRAIIDDDWRQLAGDKLSRQRPFSVLFTAADPASAVAGWAQPLHERVNLVEDEGTAVWPPELVVVGVGNAQADDLHPLELPDSTVLVALDAAGYDDAVTRLSDLLLDRIADDHRLLRRWAAPIHDLEPLVATGIEDGREVLRPSTALTLDGVNGPVRVLRYPAPRPLGDEVRAVLRQLALQATDLPTRLRHAGIVANWPLRLVLSDDDIGTVLGVLEDEPLASQAPRPTRAVADLRCGPGEAAGLGGKVLDRMLSAEENAAWFALRACQRLAVAVDLLHSHGVVLGEALRGAAVDTDDLTVLLDRMDLAEAPDPDHDDPAARFHDDRRRLAETVGAVLSADADWPGHLDVVGAALLQRARDNVNVDPPLPHEWVDYLTQRVTDLIGRPRILRTAITPQAVLRGGRVRVLWETHFAESLAIHLPDNRIETVTRDKVADGDYDVTVATPGWVRLEARNAAGSTWDHGAWVHVFELDDLLGPDGRRNPLSVVSLPEMPLLPTMSSAADMPPYTQIASYSPAVGAATSVLGELSDALADQLRTVSGKTRLDAELGAPNPLDPAAWFSRTPRLPMPRRRRWKGRS
jgi:uncharacterized protein YegL